GVRDRVNELPAGGWLRRAGHGAIAAGPARPQIQRRGADGDVDCGDRGRGGRAAVVAGEVAGGGAFEGGGSEETQTGGQDSVCGLLAWRAEVHHGGEGLLADGLPDGGVPLLPLALVVRLVAGVEQQPPAEGAPAALAAQQVPGRGTDRWADALSALGPVSGQG